MKKNKHDDRLPFTLFRVFMLMLLFIGILAAFPTPLIFMVAVFLGSGLIIWQTVMVLKDDAPPTRQDDIFDIGK